MKIIVLMAAFVAWLSSNTDMPTPEHAPRIEIVEPARVWNMYYPGQPYVEGGTDTVFALYMIGTGTIYIADTVDLDTAWGQSVLLHELAHFYQDESGRDFPCRGASEKEAYLIQKAWLAEQGVDLWDHVDPLFTLFVWQQGCGPEYGAPEDPR